MCVASLVAAILRPVSATLLREALAGPAQAAACVARQTVLVDEIEARGRLVADAMTDGRLRVPRRAREPAQATYIPLVVGQGVAVDARNGRVSRHKVDREVGFGVTADAV